MFFFFGKFDMLCFLETPVLRFILLPYYRRNLGLDLSINNTVKLDTKSASQDPVSKVLELTGKWNTQKGLSVWRGHMQNEKQVFVQKQLTKADHKLSKIFILQPINCFSWIMNLFLICVRDFLAKKGSFPAKNTCEDSIYSIYLLLHHLHIALLYYLLIPI